MTWETSFCISKPDFERSRPTCLMVKSCQVLFSLVHMSGLRGIRDCLYNIQ